MISDWHLTKAEAEKTLKSPKFGEERCLAAVERLQVTEDLEYFLRKRGKDPDSLSLQEINELADRMGYEPED